MLGLGGLLHNMSAILKIFVLLLFLFSCFACERTEQPYAGVSIDKARDSQEKVQPERTLLSNASHIQEVAPRGALAGPDGEGLFAQYCAACHQLNGQGIAGVFPPLDGTPYVTGDNVERMAAIMIYGLVGPIKVNGIEYNSAMTPFGGVMNDEQLAAVATYIRSSWSNNAGPVDKTLFEQVRAQYGERGMFQISELGEDS
jgi:mono/diheme cytochrome c family protein